MIINEWITMNFKALKLASENITKNSELAPDLLQESILIFLQDKKAQDLVNNGAATWYIVRIMITQYNSSTSPFHIKYRKMNINNSADINDINIIDESNTHKYSQQLIDELTSELNKLHWYSREVLELKYLKGSKISNLSKETGIPASSLYKELQDTKKYLKEKLKYLKKK
jgi:RNA polymerase sigma factor (sigma-70 family)